MVIALQHIDQIPPCQLVDIMYTAFVSLSLPNLQPQVFHSLERDGWFKIADCTYNNNPLTVIYSPSVSSTKVLVADHLNPDQSSHVLKLSTSLSYAEFRPNSYIRFLSTGTRQKNIAIDDFSRAKKLSEQYTIMSELANYIAGQIPQIHRICIIHDTSQIEEILQSANRLS